MSRLSSLRLPGLLCAALVLSSLSPAAAQALPEVRTALDRLEAAAGAAVKTSVSPDTGLVTFLSMDARSPVAVTGARDTSPESIALAFLQAHGSVFGLDAAAAEVELARPSERDTLGMDHVRFRQVVRGVPVTAGELTVHLRGSDVLAVNAETLPNARGLVTEPTVTAETALEAARKLVSVRLRRNDATFSEPRLEILNRGLLEGGRQASRLAWFVEARGFLLREYIWIDARTGNSLLRFSQLTDAKSRRIHNANNTATLPGTLIRSEGGAATGIVDADRAYDYSGDTYDYFANQHQRDSFDGAGAMLISTVNYCEGGCPFDNAFWDGTQMVYGLGYSAADDVVAHELTHAVTERTSNLFYYMQSGALNEAFSDIFGETVDLTNAGGTDSPAVRWKVGEDLPGGGAIRDMMNPGAFFDPGHVNGLNFSCSNADNGAVHTNSGVLNHLYALLVDGGTYNSSTVTGIGLTRAGKIAYRALTTYLLSGSGFSATADALNQSCSDLVGTAGITASDCAQVRQAIDAVDLTADLDCTNAPSQGPALCPAGQKASNVFFDNFDVFPNTSWLGDGFGIWTFAEGYSTSGTGLLWGEDVDVGFGIDYSATMAAGVALPAGAKLRFNHSYDFDTNYDGGVVEYSLNNGASWADALLGPGALPSTGATYDGSLSVGYGNPMGGQSAFTLRSHGYTGTQIDLSSLAGQTARFRFRIGVDDIFGGFGWLIDDFQIYTCTSCTYTLANPMGFVAAAGGSGTLEMVTQSGCTWSAVTAAPWLTLTTANAGSGKVGFTALPNTTGSPRSATISAGGHTFTVYQGAETDFYTVTPCRVVSTTPLNHGLTGAFAVTGGACGVPATAKAIAVNITALNSTANGNLTFYPTGVAKPSASTINFAAGTIRANNAILLLAPDGAGTISVAPFVVGGGSVSVIVDVVGYFE